MTGRSTLPSPSQPPSAQGAGSKQVWGELHGGAVPLCISASAEQHRSLTMVITSNTAEAHRLERELHFFASHTSDESRTAMPIMHLPDWETLPYDSMSPHQDIISQRLDTLNKLGDSQTGILVIPITTLMQRLLPQAHLLNHSLQLSVGQQLHVERFRTRLQKAGYHAVETVYEHGEYAIRGALIDLFPMGCTQPIRIDLFDDDIDTLRTFDPETQRTIDKIDSVDLLPAREIPLDEPGIRHFREQWHNRFQHVDHKACSIYNDINAGISPPGIEYYLPLFFDECSTLFDYLPQETQIITLGDIERSAEQFWGDVNQRYQSRAHDIERPVLEPRELFLAADDIFAQCKRFARVSMTGHSEKAHTTFNSHPAPKLPIDSRAEQPLNALDCYLMEYSGRVLFCAESAGRREALFDLLKRIQLKPELLPNWSAFLETDCQYAITVAPLDEGFVLDSPNVSVITETQLFGERVQQRRRRRSQHDNNDNIVKNLTELRTGSPVIHLDHGVGRYRGLQTIDIDGQSNEFLTLEYANEAKLYVPVTSLHLISRYSGAEEELAPLHKLGNDQWSKAKRKAAEQVRDTAAELLEIYARRAARKGHAFTNPDSAYDAFSAGFPFEETPDQEAAIHAVRNDMLSPQPMDRLVCGDVGFGKTEVAMRAAFIATYNHKQVALLAPTTLLAQQHYESLKDRFADWPVNIEVLSRFKTKKEMDATLEKVGEGKIDIIVGTHKLIQSDIRYKDLGLLIIDEEHRFGVRQKDQLKAMRAEVDVLTLTATPIPRTLNMSMAGIRDLSIIATPPAKRLSVKTFVRQRDENVIKEAILREILRGGQVYVLHNEVKTIDRVVAELQALVPEAKVGIGHGQMRERELERVMSDFYHKRFNVLVCTTIIETGIDIPSANTIIIERADKFGLAQLHQLRGRVGRSHHQAYAYLMTPNPRTITKDATKRLEAIANAQDLGAGFTLATHDLEIRGAGELLGDDQSGHIHTVGFSMYMDMLDRAVKAIKQGKQLNLEDPADDNIDINLRIPALIPDDYMPDIHSRLVMYKRLANANDDRALDELQVELIDRFGLLPDATKNLVRVTQLKLKAQQLGIKKLEASAGGGRIEFASETQVDPFTIVQLVQKQPQRYRLEGASHLKFTLDMDNSDTRLNTINDLLDTLTPKEKAA